MNNRMMVTVVYEVNQSVSDRVERKQH